MSVKLPTFQSGAVLLMMLLGTVLIATSLFLYSINQQDIATGKQQKTAEALTTAKNTLLQYAVNYYDKHPGEIGFLPCPDVNEANSEGVEHGNCAARDVSSLGRFPWRTLGLLPLKDGENECLWYAVSGPYKNASSPQTLMLNEDSHGLFEIYQSNGTNTPILIAGNNPAERAVAVLFAPGTRLSTEVSGQLITQDRTLAATGANLCGGNYGPENYLEQETYLVTDKTHIGPNTLDHFIIPRPQDTDVNDQLVYITQAEIFEAVRKRREFKANAADATSSPKKNPLILECLTKMMAACVISYANTHAIPTNKYMPLAAPDDLGTSHEAYANKDNYADKQNQKAGRFPNKINITNDNVKIKRDLAVTLLTDCPFVQPPDAECQFMTSKLMRDQLWINWKDHFFYQVADNFAPEGSQSFNCTSTPCLSSENEQCAAIITYAGTRLTSQTRTTSPPDSSSTKQDKNNYLEPEITPLDASKRNDFACCIKGDLSLACK